jgi:hypothetical protein
MFWVLPIIYEYAKFPCVYKIYYIMDLIQKRAELYFSLPLRLIWLQFITFIDAAYESQVDIYQRIPHQDGLFVVQDITLDDADSVIHRNDWWNVRRSRKEQKSKSEYRSN